MKNIIEQFALANPVGEPRAVKVGFINESYDIPALKEGDTSYFLQRINHHVFTNVAGLQRNIALITDHIRRKLQAAGESNVENRVMRLVPTKDGQLYYRTPEGDYWRMYVRIENGFSQNRATPESAYLAGMAFGEFQNQLSDIPEKLLCESIPNFHNIEFRLEQLHDAIREDKAGRVAACRELIASIESREEEMCLAENLYREGKLQKRINHCDTKVNNMMFDAAGRPLCIVDLDTVMPGFVLSDFGDFMRTAANTGAEDDPNLDNIHVDMQVYTAYTRGYLTTATFLTPLERELLPYGCRLLSYMQTVRFLTDYLNGDTYYRIEYPEHNLVRTKAQLRLLEEQEKMREPMEAVIRALSQHKAATAISKDKETEIKLDHVNWSEVYSYCPETTVRLSRTDEALRVRFDVRSEHLRGQIMQDQGEVWTDSCCEFFCRPVGDTHYQNYELNCIGTMTASRRLSRKEDVSPLSRADLLRITRRTSLPHEAIDKAGRTQPWTAEMTIPFSLILNMSDSEWRAAGCPIPTMLEANLYKCGDKTQRPHYVSWSPIATTTPDFHRPEFFGLIVL